MRRFSLVEKNAGSREADDTRDRKREHRSKYRAILSMPPVS